MWYAIIAEDKADSLDARLKARPDHVARLKRLNASGKLLVAGPNPTIDSSDPGPAGFSGSLIIAEFDSLADAKEWANQDPYILAGVYQNVIVKPFLKVLP